MNMRYYPTLHLDMDVNEHEILSISNFTLKTPNHRAFIVVLHFTVRVRATKIIIYSSSHPNVTNSCLDMAEKLLSWR